MSEKKKAPTSAATLKGAVENGRVCKTVQSPTSEHTTSPAENQPFRIADLLHPGAENAISRRDLMVMTGLSDRELRLMIETERRQGVPILSDNIHGYFLPGNSAERDRCVRSLRRRAKEIEATAAAIERSEV
jgi:biotin operon repressor